MKNHYFKTKLVKMGQWAVLPADTDTWHAEYTNDYFVKIFGIQKGLLVIHTMDDGYHHNYIPVNYLKSLKTRIKNIKGKDYKGLEKILKNFYPLEKKARTAVSQVDQKSFPKLSTRELIKIYKKNRDWVHHIVVFDQFAWLAEESWTPLMEQILTHALKLKKGSQEYNHVLFTLTKPEEISTTLLEKRAVLEQALLIKKRKSTLEKSAKILAKKFGWLPVFVFGEPWEPTHYIPELKQVLKKTLPVLEAEFVILRDYSKIRQDEIEAIVKKYTINLKDLQVFVDFGLTIDTRNEAEYFVSFAGYYLMYIYKEFAKRLGVSLKQLRSLSEQEIIDCLLKKKDAHTLLANRRHFLGFGFDKKMQKQIFFSEQETEKLFKYVERYVKPIQGGDESKGLCASPGKVKGIARIVPYPTDSNKVKQGDILITYATTTDYLPAMKRAGGIITEVGGLTCHAAVVSREFGIPCIVALKNCMKTIPDGKLIEVDADNGTIKKL